MSDIPTKNLGFIPEVRDSDYLEGTLPYEVVLASGDWRPYLPNGENQFSQVADSMACVSFSNNNIAEIQLKQQGYDFNFSDRRLAKLSGTTQQGNSFGRVEDSARHDGRCLETDWPIPPTFTWDEFYAPVPDEVNNKAIYFIENYEMVGTDSDSLKYHLKQAPIQIAIPNPHPNHAVALVYLQGNTAYYFDSYPGNSNYLKTIDVAQISAAMKIIIKPKMNQAKVVKSKTSPTVYIAYPVPDMDYLQKTANLQGILVPNDIPSTDSL